LEEPDACDKELTLPDVERFCESWGVEWPQKHLLCMAAWEGNLKVMEFAVKHGYDRDVTFINPIGLTALIDASRVGSTSSVEFLLAQESMDVAHINHRSASSGVNALCDTAMRGHYDILELLLAHRADVGIKRTDGKTALHCAAEHGHAKCVRVLLQAGADRTAQDNDGFTPIQLIETWNTEALAALSGMTSVPISEQDIKAFGNPPMYPHNFGVPPITSGI